MIVSCISAKEPFVENPGTNIGDLSPATFRVLFDEGIELQNARIELLSAKVTRLNEIVINDDNNTFSVRMGPESVCNAIKCSIPSGVYRSAEDLGNAIAKSLNDNMPMNEYRGGPESDAWNPPPGLACGWYSTINLGIIELRYRRCLIAAPTPDPTEDPICQFFQEVQNDPDMVDQLGDAVTEPVAATLPNFNQNWTNYQCSDAVKSDIRSNALVPTWRVPNTNQNQYDYCQGLDFGSLEPEYLSRKSFDQFGPWGGRGGYVAAIIKPVRCVTRSSYDAGYGGYDPVGASTDKPSYWTFEFRQNVNDDGNPILDDYQYGSLFPQDSLKDTVPHPPLKDSSTEGLSTINGCLMHSVAGNEIRGPPYNITKQLQMPYSLQATAGAPTKRRKLGVTTTWSGQIEFGAVAGAPYKKTPVPDNYTFQMNGETAAVSLCRRHQAQTDKVRVRMTHQGLMAGLPQQNVAEGPIVDTVIEAPLINPPQIASPSAIQYIRGQVGRYNSWDGDARVEGAVRDSNDQGHLNTTSRDKKDFRLPWYKIIEVDNDPALLYGSAPTKILTVDSGEYIQLGVDQDSTLWLNDKNTWRFLPGTGPTGTPTQTLLSQMYRVMPAAADIMFPTNPKVEKQVQTRIPSFNMGLIRDDIHYHQIKNARQFMRDNFSKYGKNSSKAFDVPKTLEVNVISQMFDSNNNEIPAAGGGEGAIRVYCSQLQPTTFNDDYYQTNYDTSDEKKVLVNGTSNTWGTLNGDGTAPSQTELVSWANFVGVNNPNAAVQVRLNTVDVYNYKVTISHTVNINAAPVVWSETTCLCATGVTRNQATGAAYNKMLSFMKARFFPLHPTVSILPSSTEEKNIVWLSARGTKYPYRPIESGGVAHNYRFNEGNIIVNNERRTYNTLQNLEAPTPTISGNTLGGLPLICLKFRKLFIDQVTDPPPAGGSTGLVAEKDFQPAAIGSLYNGGFHSVYYEQTAGAGALFSGQAPPVKQAFIPTYVVEIKNLPLTGYISKAFDYGRLEDKKGSGQRRPIVGVVPAFEQVSVATAEQLVNYLHNTPYPQPVNLALPTKQFFYHFDIDLRSILDGKLLNSLIHSTEIVLRITPLE